MNDGTLRYSDRVEVRDTSGRVVMYMPVEDAPPSQRYAQWEAERGSHEPTDRREMTAALESNPSYSIAVPGDDPVLRRPVLPSPQHGHLPVITDRSTSWRSPAEIAACRWPDHMPLTDLISHRIISPPCTEQDFAMRLHAAGQSERACQLRAFEAQEAGWFTMPATAVNFPSTEQLAHELDTLVHQTWCPRPTHTGSHEPHQRPNGDIPSWAPKARTETTGLPTGFAINARAEVLAQVQANLAEVRRLLHPTLKGLTLRGSRDDWS